MVPSAQKVRIFVLLVLSIRVGIFLVYFFVYFCLQSMFNKFFLLLSPLKMGKRHFRKLLKLYKGHLKLNLSIKLSFLKSLLEFFNSRMWSSLILRIRAKLSSMDSLWKLIVKTQESWVLQEQENLPSSS